MNNKQDHIFGMRTVKKSMICAVCIALSVILPTLFHSIPNAGQIYSPIHIPALLCGLLCGWQYGLLCGASGVLLSTLITQMPPMQYMPAMLIECAVYGLLCGLLMRFIHTRHLTLDLYLSLVLSMLGGRIIAGIAKALFFMRGSFTISMWVTAYFVTSLPGILIHLILVPVLILILLRARLIPARCA